MEKNKVSSWLKVELFRFDFLLKSGSMSFIWVEWEKNFIENR